MRRLSGLAVGLFAALFLGFAIGTAGAAERTINSLPQSDLPGFDYQILKDISLKQCQQACISDRACRAFTFNEKSDWCFLKGAAAEPISFPDATSGIIAQTPTYEDIALTRQTELDFPAMGLIQSAREMAAGLSATDPHPKGLTYIDLVTEADAALAAGNAANARVLYRQALGVMDNDLNVWLRLTGATQTLFDLSLKSSRSGDYSLATEVTYEAINAYLRSEGTAERAATLAALARGLEDRQMWHEAIVTYRQSLSLVDDGPLQARLEKVIAEHGFRIVSHEVDAEAAQPRICAVFSESLPSGDTDLSSYVTIAGNSRLAIETEDDQICVEGVSHGERYEITLRTGLPSASGEKLRNDVNLSVFVPDRSPFVGFANDAYVMPAGLGGGLPISSVNADTADVAIYRIGDRSIATAVRDGLFQSNLSEYSAEDIAYESGEKIFEGQVDLASAPLNQMVVTAIPVADVLTDIAPGAYVITAKVTGSQQAYWRDTATQWFIVTDLGLSEVAGNDGVHAFVRSLTSTAPIAGAHVKLVAVNNEVLGEGVTDEAGRVDFAPGLSRGTGGSAPQLLAVETDDGDYAFLDVNRPAFDLTDRGVAGRAAPGPLDLFATSERGVYRPGETVYLTALLRDSRAEAMDGLALTMKVIRPDGVLSSEKVLSDKGAGSYFDALFLRSDEMTGAWSVRFYADPKADALADVTFLVEDFEPERLAFDISAPEGPVDPDQTFAVNVDAKYLYGATAPDLDIEADVILRPRSTLADYPGYTFGREDDTIRTDQEPLGIVGTTDGSGHAVAEISLPQPQPTTMLLDADVILRLIDSNGRPVERSLTRPVLSSGDRIGIKADFRGSDLGEGAEAGFDVITVAPDGTLAGKAGLTWTLSRITTQYQWYRDGGAWKWEAITNSREVANGTFDTNSDGPSHISAPVNWGRYLVEIHSSGADPTSSSFQFYAGYYYADAGSDTPDTLQVALDKQVYKIGDVATLKLEPQFAGTALVMVVDDRIIDLRAVDVPAEGTSIELPVTEDWGPGAYVTAMLYRPADAAEKRMPSRAVGLEFADVDPGERLLDVGLDVPKEAEPRQSFTATVNLGDAVAGQEAYVAVTAVDLGILNLTGFQTPDPDGYFFGQRQLGVELRDLYGQLIDPTQGLPGAIRSGGDGGPVRHGTPPPTSVLVALHSGIVKVDENGVAKVEFDMPDFNGTVRVMAMAWTDKAVGHAAKDVVVHDPVVVTLSPPRFLRVGDQSRLLVEVANISGPEGSYRVELKTASGLKSDMGEEELNLAAGGRASISFGLMGTAIGDHELRLLVTDPDGNALVKNLTLGVRANSVVTSANTTLPLGAGESLTLDQSRLNEYLPETAQLTLAVGPLARLNVPELLLQLDRYPYGCAEQVTSRALPLLYLNEVANMVGLGDDKALAERIDNAIADLLTKQTSNGSFGVWGPWSYSDFWLDAYVTDFLLRAKEAGYEVPELALERALDNLSNQLSYASDFDKGGEDVAYALYDLARAGRASIGDLRYYLEARIDQFGSPLAKAQLGAALALYGERVRAATGFAAAVADLGKPDDDLGYRSDYGSRLRDLAGVLALVAEFKPSGIDTANLTKRLATLRDLAGYTSTQEDAWSLLAAASLGENAASGDVSINGQPVSGPAYRRFLVSDLGDGLVTITNNSNQPTEVTLTTSGIPTVPPPAENHGFVLNRAYYQLDGTPIENLDAVTQNDRFVVVLSANARTLGSGQYVITDPLPAGFEIENPDLSASSGVGDLSWLSVNRPSHTESRTDHFMAAFRYSSEAQTFSTAYLVRAVTPGTFTLPGAAVEDMYRPDLRANLGAGTVTIAPAGR
ncbi:MAG: alpha-2-macroglobulin family protein [Hyphomicrobiaceae bacterium]|nr:alpha-2-macroglobulin family protein [Hyphomicrobiaceae bacterium]MCC0022778.1 alpha-2-macroglobulin family protein [Hyphomicrobiaceae bacterium]